MGFNINAYWIADGGVSAHLSYRRDWFHEFTPSVDSGSVVMLGDDDTCAIEGTGTIFIEKYLNGIWVPSQLDAVLYISRLKTNLLSVGVCTQKDIMVNFKEEKVEFFRGHSNDNCRLFAKGV